MCPHGLIDCRVNWWRGCDIDCEEDQTNDLDHQFTDAACFSTAMDASTPCGILSFKLHWRLSMATRLASVQELPDASCIKHCNGNDTDNLHVGIELWPKNKRAHLACAVGAVRRSGLCDILTVLLIFSSQDIPTYQSWTQKKVAAN